MAYKSGLFLLLLLGELEVEFLPGESLNRYVFLKSSEAVWLKLGLLISDLMA